MKTTIKTFVLRYQSTKCPACGSTRVATTALSSVPNYCLQCGRSIYTSVAVAK